MSAPLTLQASLFDPPGAVDQNGPVAAPQSPAANAHGEDSCVSEHREAAPRDWGAFNRAMATLPPVVPRVAADGTPICIACGEGVAPRAAIVMFKTADKASALFHLLCHGPWYAARVAATWAAVPA
ncbi:hypothetical protein sos41_11540 [Alphaproteobacteria bacterium SO-S41]|nr:hypothetical protein sos41_11540 [Alphaproteobacteria bacterium SO-S41]